MDMHKKENQEAKIRKRLPNNMECKPVGVRGI
jgi:hypothetical protein